MVATDMYTYSSHAHSAFIVKVRVDLEDSHVVRESKILFLDLAGNDKVSQEIKFGYPSSPVSSPTLRRGPDQRRESAATNKSLASLGHVMQVLAQQSTKKRKEA